MTLDRQERRFTGGREKRRQFIDQLQGSLEPTAHLLDPGRITKDCDPCDCDVGSKDAKAIAEELDLSDRIETGCFHHAKRPQAQF